MKKAGAAFLLVVFAFSVSFSALFAAPRPARAQYTDPITSVQTTLMNAGRTIENQIVPAIVMALANGVNYFTQQLAYQLAVMIVSGCPGQKSCWSSKSLGSMVGDAAKGAVGEAVGTLSKEGGFEKLGLNLCNPSASFKLRIQLGLLQEYKPPGPKCEFSAIASNWKAAVNSLSPSELANNVWGGFEPGQNPLSVSLAARVGVNEKAAKAETQGFQQKLLWYAGGGGFSDVQDPVTGRIKTPAVAVLEEFKRAEAQKKSKPQDYQQQSVAGQIAKGAVTSILLGTAQTFAMTLITQLWNKAVNGLLSSQEAAEQEPEVVLSEEGLVQTSQSTAAAALQVRFSSPPMQDVGTVDPMVDFINCPPTGRSVDNCVMDAQFANAVRVSVATPITVQNAIDQGMLHGDWPLISSSDKAQNTKPDCYTFGYCESNLKKLRAARIISIGWEIAAHKSSVGKPIKLKDVVAKFNDCNSSGEIDDKHPYCHLIDPDWVLAQPVTQCRALSYGSILVSSEIPTRAESCVDRVTCLQQDDYGNCIGNYGYCARERSVWRFSGDSCPAEYNTCRTFTPRSGTNQSLLLNTLEFGVCNANNVGCRRYATTLNSINCNLTSQCQSVQGCACTTTSSCSVKAGAYSCLTPAGETCTLTGAACAPNYTYSPYCTCSIDHSCRVENGAQSCSSLVGNETDASDDWQSTPARFFNLNARSCSTGDNGCSSVTTLLTGQSLNLVRNGSFENRIDGDSDGSPDHPADWSPFGDAPANSPGYVSSDGSKASGGLVAVRVGPATADANFAGECTMAKCDLDAGCACKDPSGYSCRVLKGDTRCSYTDRVMQDRVPVSVKRTYTLSASFAPAVTDGPVSAKLKLRFVNDHDQNMNLTAAQISAIARSDEPGSAPSTRSCKIVTDNTSADYGSLVATITSTDRYYCSFVIDLNPTNNPALSGGPTVTHATLEITGAATYVDDVMLEEGGGSEYHDGYGGASTVNYIKIPPAYLGCTGESTDREECGSFARVCRENEVGCDLYTPASGDAPIPGVVGLQDVCPKECSGYDVFKQEKSDFDLEKFPVYFIPATAKICTAQDVGCSEFTNLDNEQVSYYSKLRLCQSPNLPDGQVFYSWEGSDTTGYQLKVWNFKRTGTKVSWDQGTTGSDICANPAHDSCDTNKPVGASDTVDTNDHQKAGTAPCTKVTYNAAGSMLCDDADQTAYCKSNDTKTNFDCREFYDEFGNRHYRLQSRAIIATADCHRYRITAAVESDCVATSGRWDTNKQECVYLASAPDSLSCGATVNGCRSFKGNAGANVRPLSFSDFETWGAEWVGTGGDPRVTQSTESVIVGGHSMKIAQGGGLEAHMKVGGLVATDRSYKVNFWARGNGQVRVAFKRLAGPGTYISCDLATACPAGTAGGCTCTFPNGSTCQVDGNGTDKTCNLYSINQANPVICFSAGSDCPTSVVPVPATVKLSADWRQYELGPIIVSSSNSDNAGFNSTAIDLSFKTDGASDVYVDNFTLQEVKDSITVVKDSWQTPASCDMTLDGAPSPREMLGCRQYTNTAQTDVYLRSFSQLCRNTSVGCAAFSNSQNTPGNPYAETYNAVCRLDTRCGGTAISGTNCVCNYDLRHPAIPANKARLYLSDVCRVAIGEYECRFHLDYADAYDTLVSHPDTAVIPADQRAFLVANNQSLCPSTSAGCRNLGQPQVKYEATCSDYGTVANKINITLNGKDVTCADAGGVASGGNTCTFNVCKPDWENTAQERVDKYCLCTDTKTQSICRVESGANSCAYAKQSETVDSWQATTLIDDPATYGQTLCLDTEVGCDRFAAKDGAYYFKDPGNKACEFKENITFNGKQRSGWFRKSASGALFPCYSELIKNGDFFAIYKNADPSCKLDAPCDKDNGCTCYVSTDPRSPTCDLGTTCTSVSGLMDPQTGTCPCPTLDKPSCLIASGEQTCTADAACTVTKGNTNCGYAGWAGICEGKYDRCEEFVDPAATSPQHPAGEPYYYIVNSKLDTGSCTGNVNLKQGCVLFKQTSNAQNLFSAAASYLKSEQTGQGQSVSVSAVNCTLAGKSDYCMKRCFMFRDGVCKDNPDQRCSQNTDCGGGECVGSETYGFGCLSDADCNVGMGESCVMDANSIENMDACAKDPVNCPCKKDPTSCHSDSRLRQFTVNDANVVVKVKPDRECAQWLGCMRYNTEWDADTKKWRKNCTSFGMCDAFAQSGKSDECGHPVDTTKTRLTPEIYSQRDITWRGFDYSGFSLVNKYPPQYLVPVKINKGHCLDAGNANADSGSECRSTAECASLGTTFYCGPLLPGVCTGSGTTFDGSSCSTNADCVGGFCSKSDFDIQRYGINLTLCRGGSQQGLACSKDSECPGSTCAVLCQQDTECPADANYLAGGGGRCYQHKCYYSFSGGPLEVNEWTAAPSCRAYPEADAPYGMTIVDSRATGFDDATGLATEKNGNFRGANICTKNNQCECNYQRYSYGKDALVKYHSFSPTDLAASKVFEKVCVGGDYNGQDCSKCVATDPPTPCTACGGTGSGSTCTKVATKTYAVGWPGFCLDRDESQNINNDDRQYPCILWLPVDKLSGLPDRFNQFREAGYNPPGGVQEISYCSVAQGNKGSANNYTANVNDITTLSGSEGKCSGGAANNRACSTPEECPAKYKCNGGSKDGDNCKPNPVCVADDAGNSDTPGVGASCTQDSDCSGDTKCAGICPPDGDEQGSCELTESGSCNATGFFNETMDWFFVKRHSPWYLGVCLGSLFFSPWLIIPCAMEWGDNPEAHVVHTPTTATIYKDQLAGIEINTKKGILLLQPARNFTTAVGFDGGDFSGGFEQPAGSGIKYFIGTDSNDSCVKLLDEHLAYNKRAWQEPTDTNLDNYCNSQAWGKKNCVAARARFNSAGKMVAIDTAMCINDGAGCCDFEYSIGVNSATAYLRENCSEFTHVYSQSAGGEYPGIALTNNLYRATAATSPFKMTGFEDADYTHTTTRPGVELAGDTTPFGRAAPSATPTETYSRDTFKLPIPVWGDMPATAAGDGGSPYTWYKTSDTGASYTQTGDDPDVAGYPFSCVGSCAKAQSSGKGSNAAATAQGRIKQLFAVAWDLKQWSGHTATEYTTIKNAQGVGWDVRGELIKSGQAAVTVIGVDTTKCIGEGQCPEASDPADTITANESTDDDGGGTCPAGKVCSEMDEGKFRVTYKVYAYTDKDRFPFRRVTFDFYGDGTLEHRDSTPGFIKAHRGIIPDPTDPQGKKMMSKCNTNNGDWGLTPQSCDPAYLQFVINYTCTREMVQSGNEGVSLPTCSSSTPVYPCSNGTACVYRARVQLVDNWGVCNGTCPIGAAATTCMNADPLNLANSQWDGGGGQSPKVPCAENFDSIDTYNADKAAANKYLPWTWSKNEIVVYPEP